ncbi:MAG: NAD(P)H-dependent oxidoreductase [Cyclobacteriaceae bacterium]
MKILGINGSASPNSSNLSLLNAIKKMIATKADMNIIDDLSPYPHFDTEKTDGNTPNIVS